MESWHDRGVAHSTSRCASLQRTHELQEHFLSEQNFCPLLQQQRVESPHIVVFCGLSRSRFSIAHDSTHVMCTTVDVTQMLLKGQRRRIMERQMGGSPKALPTASGRENQPAADDLESNRGCPGLHNNRKIDTRLEEQVIRGAHEAEAILEDVNPENSFWRP